MKAITEMVNFTCGGARALTHRKLKNFLDLPLFCDVRWPSAGDCLKRFFALRNKILVFFESEIAADINQFENDLKNPDFMSALAV